MRIELALRLRPGMRVKCPGDRDDPAYVGVVVHAPGEPQSDLLGSPFVWLTVREEGGEREAFWPSNLLTHLSPDPAPEEVVILPAP